MTGSDDMLRCLAQAHGVYLDFHDLHGHQHAASPDTLRALLRALGVRVDTDADMRDALAEVDAATARIASEHIVLAGHPSELHTPTPCTWVLLDEADQVLSEGHAERAIALPPLQVGYFRLNTTSAGNVAQTFVLSRPARAPDLQGRACWGTTGALYGLRSSRNGGLGSYDDLAAAAQTFGQQGAQFFGINPVHALGWAMEDIISPYSPSHRGMFNIDHVAPVTSLGPTPGDDLIDYASFRAIHRPQLEKDFAQFRKSGARAVFDRWKASVATDVVQFAQFEALSERYGFDFRTWPAALQTPGPMVEEKAAERTEFHLWLQWRATQQIGAAQDRAQGAGMALGLYLDLAVGPRPDGAEVWMNDATIAKGVTIGAPPDHLSPEGQSWTLAAHAPGPLARSGYAPLRSMLRRLMQTCGLLRIDHALGLLRSYWLPDDGSPGGYVTQPLDSLLAVILIEAHQTGCVVVGEDLGLVPNGFRAAMRDAGLYSYAVWQFEADDQDNILPASALPRHALACFGTHDTPTVQGFWHGTDIDWWHQVGWLNSTDRLNRHAHRARQRASLRRVCGLHPNTAPGAIADHIHGSLAHSPAALVSVQLDDVFEQVDAQNLPGTIDAHPNWRRRLPIPVEDMAHDARLRQIANTMSAHRPAPQITDPTDCPEEISA
ncbi:4-alpha-glucanotransferase [Marivita sp. S6314]|uniref:4-alpha-glucanotransferase n=1 Tax=Marivita sp. S6314 TaxID=2926406 RepID=UPI001FF235DB|nr:4-alpha-glucanotransferase [Marivita sp. S6314]MCK0150531.1 4-alpha-glucanotransferase [Marivita sp. S6314]